MVHQSENSLDEEYISQALKEVTSSLITDIETKREFNRKYENSTFLATTSSIILVFIGIVSLFYAPNLEPKNQLLMESFAAAVSFISMLVGIIFVWRQSRIKRMNEINHEIDTEHKAELLNSLIQRHRAKRDHTKLTERKENILEELRLLEAEAALKKLNYTKKR